jgi:nicotinamide-nucleotide adenylyltransferase
MSTALYLGRFQPIHSGHVLSIRSMLEEVDELILVVGSALKSFSVRNPFTAGERIEMLRRALLEADIPMSRVTIVAVPDTLPPNHHSIYVSQVKTYCPKFEIVYSRNPLVKTLFEQAGYEVREHQEFERERFWGTTIRQQIIDDGDWRDAVPASVARYIEEIGGVERLKQLSGTDEPKN